MTGDRVAASDTVDEEIDLMVKTAPVPELH
jgi:hypothetical protein